ncbi:hypothetical protein [Oenococcus oeni]|uniref:hypothetical protein n=1 Tax=Oenococcus oeni TaxID=1247 RepID=UPI0010BB6920|nr:hypothetical protein [Oenococcus oeni]SYW19496.1 hypothetical protein OENI_160044 [Oenococcus oeni]
MKLIAFNLAIILLMIAFNLHRKTKVSKSEIDELNSDTDCHVPQESTDTMNVLKIQHKRNLKRLYRKPVHK